MHAQITRNVAQVGILGPTRQDFIPDDQDRGGHDACVWLAHFP